MLCQENKVVVTNSKRLQTQMDFCTLLFGFHGKMIDGMHIDPYDIDYETLCAKIIGAFRMKPGAMSG